MLCLSASRSLVSSSICAKLALLPVRGPGRFSRIKDKDSGVQFLASSAANKALSTGSAGPSAFPRGQASVVSSRCRGLTNVRGQTADSQLGPKLSGAATLSRRLPGLGPLSRFSAFFCFDGALSTAESIMPALIPTSEVYPSVNSSVKSIWESQITAQLRAAVAIFQRASLPKVTPPGLGAAGEDTGVTDAFLGLVFFPPAARYPPETATRIQPDPFAGNAQRLTRYSLCAKAMMATGYVKERIQGKRRTRWKYFPFLYPCSTG